NKEETSITAVRNVSSTFATECKSKVFYQACLAKANTLGIQLELTGSMSTDAVMNALRYIFARVGMTELMYSDNGKSFVKADKLLQEFLMNTKATILKATRYFRNKVRIKWHFQTPLSPWKEGMFKRLICTVKKNCFQSMTFAGKYTFEHL